MVALPPPFSIVLTAVFRQRDFQVRGQVTIRFGRIGAVGCLIKSVLLKIDNRILYEPCCEPRIFTIPCIQSYTLGISLRKQCCVRTDYVTILRITGQPVLRQTDCTPQQISRWRVRRKTF